MTAERRCPTCGTSLEGSQEDPARHQRTHGRPVRSPRLVHASIITGTRSRRCDAWPMLPPGWRLPARRMIRLELLEQEARALEAAVDFAKTQFERATDQPIPVLDRVHRRLRVALGDFKPP
jgi:hypothetical protein